MREIEQTTLTHRRKCAYLGCVAKGRTTCIPIACIPLLHAVSKELLGRLHGDKALTSVLIPFSSDRPER